MAQITDWLRELSSLLLSRWMGRQVEWQPAYAPVRRSHQHLSRRVGR